MCFIQKVFASQGILFWIKDAGTDYYWEKKEKFTIQFVFSIRGICILHFASINLGFH